MARSVKYYASASERAEALETVIFELGEAIEALDGIAGYENTVDTLTDIQEKDAPWSGTFFIIDPELFGDDTIITDLR